ncbi:MAG: hypothetical protein R3B99_16850 [Polyangiales bacterium]|nr:hypothetical protein [Sandaracinus sp.]
MRPRLVTPNACVALTRRTVLRKAFLTPWAGGGASGWDEVGQTFAYAAALAQRSTGIDWHQLVLNANHHHSQATPREYELAEATRVLHRTTAGALNALLRARGFDAPGSVWDSRQTHWRTLVDVEAVASRLLYDDVNCVAAGWVAHPLDVPFGHHFGFEHWKAGGLAVPKPDNPFFSKRMPAELELRLTPPIALVREFEGDVDAVVAAMSALRDEQLKALAATRSGPVRGVAAMRAVHPWDEPDSEVAEGDTTPFAVGRAGDEGKALRAHCLGEAHGFWRSHHERIDGWKKGDRTSPFPAGTLRGCTFLGMKVDLPAEDAVLCAPFPSREEVEAELAEMRAARERLETARQERARLREARRQRAEELAEVEGLERALEDAMRGVKVEVDPLRRVPVLEVAPEDVTRRVLGAARPRAKDGKRVVVLRTRAATRRRRGNNDPPE